MPRVVDLASNVDELSGSRFFPGALVITSSRPPQTMVGMMLLIHWW